MLDPRSSETEFRLLADNAPVMIWRSGTDALCDWFNKPWLDFTGRPLEKELGNGWAEGVHPDDMERCLKIYLGAFEQRETFSMEYRLRRHDGAYRWLLDNGRPFYRDGIFCGYFGSCIDITEQRDREERLNILVQEREALLREVHHRVNNNLQTLTAFVRLRRRTADESGRVVLSEMGHHIAAMSAVQRFLYSRDHLAFVSLREMLGAVLPEIAMMKARIGPGDRMADLHEAANLGLAVAEIVSLFDGASSDIRIAFDETGRVIELSGKANPHPPNLTRQLADAYAGAAQASLEDQSSKAGELHFTLRLANKGTL